MKRKIVYLINPISGTRKKGSLPRLIEQRTAAHGVYFEILPTHIKGDYSSLVQKIREESITDVVICGGDGSVNQVLAQLKEQPVQFGIIPMGSGNGLALAAGIPTTPEKALDIILDNHALPIDGFYINNRFSCMLCGIGLDAQVAHDFDNDPKRGLQTYARISALDYWKAKPYRFSIELADNRIETEAFFISIANSNQFGNNFTIAPRASLHDGLLDIVVVKKMNKFALPFSVLAQVAGMNDLQKEASNKAEKGILYFQTASLTIHNTDGAPLHIDGDPGSTAASFNIRVIPGAFRLLQPA